MAVTDAFTDSMFRPGDVVTIRSDLSTDGEYVDESGTNLPAAASIVFGFCGKEVTIKRVIREYGRLVYTIEEDRSDSNFGDGWYWCASMFEDRDPYAGAIEIKEDNLIDILSM